jgi:hypothetical protein
MRGNTFDRSVRIICIGALCAVALLGPGALSGRAQTASDRDQLRDSVSTLEAELQDALDRYQATAERVAAIQSSIAENQLAIERLARKMIRREAMAVDVATELYKGGGSIALAGILSSKSLADMNTGLKYLESSGQMNAEVFEKLASEHEELEKRLDELDRARAAAMQAEDQMARLRDRIASRIQGQRSRLSSINESLRRAAADTVEAPIPSSAPAIPKIEARNGRQPDWIAIARCESGLRWHLDSTYDGGLQFHPMTWLGYGGSRYSRYAWQASPEEQIAIAERVLADQGPGAWPNCFQWKD